MPNHLCRAVRKSATTPGFLGDIALFAESRAGNPYGFNVLRYLARYPDLQAAFASDVQAATIHYIRYGYREGRSAV